MTTLAGGGVFSAYVDGTGAEARFSNPVGLTSDGTHLYVADEWNEAIRKVTIATGEVTTLASGFRFRDITTDGTHVYASHVLALHKIEIATGYVTEMVLSGTVGPERIGALVTDGTYLYALADGRRVVKIAIATGESTVLAGSEVQGNVDGTGTEARFSFPWGIAIDGGNLYVADAANHSIRKIVIATGEVTTIAGAGTSGPDDGTGKAAKFNYPKGIASDGTNLYVGDRDNHRVRKVVIATGVVTTLAGSGERGGVDGAGKDATFDYLHGIVVDASASDDSVIVYVADTDNNKIRKIDHTPGDCPAAQYSIGGNVTGLTAKLVLQNNADDDTTVTENGTFTFAKTLVEGSDYDVTVKTQPNGQVCTVTSGKGTANAAVSDIKVSCEASATPPSDATPPTAPTIVDLTTVDRQPVLTGTYDATDAEGGFTVKVNGTKFTLGTDAALTTSVNDWTLTMPSEMAIGIYDITATAMDAAGNISSASGTLTVVAPPPVPTVMAVTTKDPTPTLSGTFDSANAAMFTVAVNDVTYSMGTDAALSNAGNSWNLTIPDANALAVGTYDVVATATDAANAVKTDTTTNELVVTGTTSTWSLEDHYTNDTTPTISGTFPTDASGFTVRLGRSLSSTSSVWWMFAETRTDPEHGDVLFNTENQTQGNVGTFNRETGEWQLTITNGLTESYQFTDELSEGTYLLRLVNGPSSSWSPLVGFAKLVVDLTAPTAPTVTSQTTSDTTPTITGTFDAADAEGGLTVTVNSVTYTLGTDAALSSAGDTWSLSIPAENALLPDSYNVVATATDRAGNAATDSSTDELLVLPSVPAVPTGVSASAGDAQITLSWTAVSGATSYNAYYATSSGVTTASGTKVPGVISDEAITGLTNGTTYHFIVTAENVAGESEASSEVSATPVDMQAPTVSATPGSASFTTSVDVTLSCTDTGGSGCAAIHYTLDGSTPTTASTTYTTAIAITSTTTLKFLAVDGAGNESVVNTETYTLSLPAAPTGVLATGGDAQVSVIWSAVSGASSYNVYHGTSSGETMATGTKIPNATSGLAITGLSNGTTYYFVVTAENASGEGIPSGEVSAIPQVLDTTPPAVSSGGLSPADGATGVARDSSITAIFNEDILATTVNDTSFTLMGSSALSGTVSFNGISNTATFTPDSRMAMLTSHTATLTTGITDLAGNHLAVDVNWSFTTADGAWGTTATVDTSDTEDSNGGRVVVDEQGNAMAVWLQFDGSSNSVVANRYVPTTGWGTPELLSAGDASGVDLAVDGDGNVFAIWMQDDGSGMVWDIWVRRYDAAADTWGAAEQLSDVTAAGAPQIAVDGSGNAIVVWNQTDGALNHIWASRYASGIWSAAELIESDDSTDAYDPAIAMNLAGNAVVVWHQGDGFFNGDIMARSYSAGTWGSTHTIDSGIPPALFPRVAIDDSGNAIAVWVQEDDASVINIHANRYDAVAGTWGTATTIADGTGNGMMPQIAMGGDGNALVVWVNDEGNGVWSNLFDIATTWASPERIDNLVGTVQSPQIAMDAAGNGMAVWFQIDGIGRDSTFANRYVKDGGWGTAAAIEADDIYDSQPFNGPVGLWMNSKGEAMALWHQRQSSGMFDVWANSFE